MATEMTKGEAAHDMISFIDFGIILDSCLQHLESYQQDEISRDITLKLEALNRLLTKALEKRPRPFWSRKIKSKKYEVPLPDPFLCPLCTQNCSNYESLKSHLPSCYSYNEPSTWSKTNLCILWDCLECKNCQLKYANFNDFRTHALEHHPSCGTLFCAACSIPVINNEVNYLDHIQSTLHRHWTSREFAKTRKSFHITFAPSSFHCTLCKRSHNYHRFCGHMYSRDTCKYVIYCKKCDSVVLTENAWSHTLEDRHVSWPTFSGVCPLCGMHIVGWSSFLNHVKKVCSSLAHDAHSSSRQLYDQTSKKLEIEKQDVFKIKEYTSLVNYILDKQIPSSTVVEKSNPQQNLGELGSCLETKSAASVKVTTEIQRPLQRDNSQSSSANTSFPSQISADINRSFPKTNKTFLTPPLTSNPKEPEKSEKRNCCIS